MEGEGLSLLLIDKLGGIGLGKGVCEGRGVRSRMRGCEPGCLLEVELQSELVNIREADEILATHLVGSTCLRLNGSFGN